MCLLNNEPMFLFIGTWTHSRQHRGSWPRTVQLIWGSLDESEDFKRPQLDWDLWGVAKSFIRPDRKVKRVKTWAGLKNCDHNEQKRAFFGQWPVRIMSYLLWCLSICMCVCVCVLSWWGGVFLHLVLISVNYSWYFWALFPITSDTDWAVDRALCWRSKTWFCSCSLCPDRTLSLPSFPLYHSLAHESCSFPGWIMNTHMKFCSDIMLQLNTLGIFIYHLFTI